MSIDQYSPRQFDKIQLTMSSKTPGVFTMRLESTLLGIPSRIATEDVRMEDLLQAKYENRPSFALFNGKVIVHFESFLDRINKKYILPILKIRYITDSCILGSMCNPWLEEPFLLLVGHLRTLTTIHHTIIIHHNVS